MSGCSCCIAVMLRQRCLWGFRRPVWGALATFPHPLPWRPVVGPCSPLFYFLRLLLACLIYVSSETLIRLPHIRPSYNYPISLPNTTSLTHFTPLPPTFNTTYPLMLHSSLIFIYPLKGGPSAPILAQF